MMSVQLAASAKTSRRQGKRRDLFADRSRSKHITAHDSQARNVQTQTTTHALKFRVAEQTCGGRFRLVGGRLDDLVHDGFAIDGLHGRCAAKTMKRVAG
jgi:hypothetical protein